MTMTTSPAGRAAIRQREGCKLTAYQDSVGVWTIGVGHTGRTTPPVVHAGMTITQEQADDCLTTDLEPFEAAVNAAITRPMTQSQFDACVSLAFNIGVAGFAGSTVVHKFNAGDIPAAAKAFLLWDKPPELESRRKRERDQFLEPDHADEMVRSSDRAPKATTGPNITGVKRTSTPGGFWARAWASLTR